MFWNYVLLSLRPRQLSLCVSPRLQSPIAVCRVVTAAAAAAEAVTVIHWRDQLHLPVFQAVLIRRLHHRLLVHHLVQV